jgi:hypothetical protein
MSQDLTEIKKQLKNCEEVDTIYDIKIGQKVKYITIKNGDEYFYEGGEYVKMGDNKIVLKHNSKYEYVPLVIHNKGGYTVYRTRLFVVDLQKDMIGGGVTQTDDSSKEYEKIIKTQQNIIEKMNLQLKKQHEYILKLQEEINNHKKT